MARVYDKFANALGAVRQGRQLAQNRRLKDLQTQMAERQLAAYDPEYDAKMRALKMKDMESKIGYREEAQTAPKDMQLEGIDYGPSGPTRKYGPIQKHAYPYEPDTTRPTPLPTDPTAKPISPTQLPIGRGTEPIDPQAVGLQPRVANAGRGLATTQPKANQTITRQVSPTQPSGIAERQEPPQTITQMETKEGKMGELYQIPKEVTNPNHSIWVQTQKNLEKIKTDELGRKAESEEAMRGVAGLLKNTVAVWKGAQGEIAPIYDKMPKMRNEAGDVTFDPVRGIVGSNVGKLAELSGAETLPWTKAYDGQLIEAAMAHSKIITGGSRIIRSVINKLIQTYPVNNALEKDMHAKVYQTIMNSMRRVYGDEFGALQPELQKQALDMVRNILQTEPAEIPNMDVEPKEYNKNFTVNGILYEGIPRSELREFFEEEVKSDKDVVFQVDDNGEII